MDQSPKLLVSSYPRSEQPAVHFVQQQLDNLDQRCRELNAAIRLFDYCDYLGGHPHPGYTVQIELAGQWAYFAAREAAASVYRFDEDAEALTINLNKSPALLAKIDVKAKREASRAFKRNFPDFEALRHSGQHHSKLYGTPERKAEHAPGYFSVVNGMFGRTYLTSFGGKNVSMDITERTLAKLMEVRDLFWGAFKPAAFRGPIPAGPPADLT